MTDWDDLRAARLYVAANLVEQDVRAVYGDSTADYVAESMRQHFDRAALLAEHPEPPSDEAAMHIDPEPPGVTTRPFTDAEVAALDAQPTTPDECRRAYWCRRAWIAAHLTTEPPSGGEVTADELAEVIADGVVAYFKTISYLADTSDEGWADEHEIAKHGQARRSAAAILARFDVRRRKP